MSGSDPSQVDSATLLRSLARDLGMARGKMIEAADWLSEALVTVYELSRRADEEAKKSPAGEGGAKVSEPPGA